MYSACFAPCCESADRGAEGTLVGAGDVVDVGRGCLHRPGASLPDTFGMGGESSPRGARAGVLQVHKKSVSERALGREKARSWGGQRWPQAAPGPWKQLPPASTAP